MCTVHILQFGTIVQPCETHLNNTNQQKQNVPFINIAIKYLQLYLYAYIIELYLMMLSKSRN